MKPRIEKKLSKRLLQLAPSLFNDSWVDRERMESAWDYGVCVSHCYCVGGALDYWGEGQDAYTLWAAWTGCGVWAWEWHGLFESYPDGHEHHGYPGTKGFKPTTRNLLQMAAEYEARQQAEGE